jgi:hypothetical protein
MILLEQLQEFVSMPPFGFVVVLDDEGLAG